MKNRTKDNLIIWFWLWIWVAFYVVLQVMLVIWRIFGDHHAHNGAMPYLGLHTG